jgi:hypothetical protein
VPLVVFSAANEYCEGAKITQKAKLVEPTTFPIDTNKYPYDVLVAYAQRVTTLLTDPFVRGNKDAAGSLD